MYLLAIISINSLADLLQYTNLIFYHFCYNFNVLNKIPNLIRGLIFPLVALIAIREPLSIMTADSCFWMIVTIVSGIVFFLCSLMLKRKTNNGTITKKRYFACHCLVKRFFLKSQVSFPRTKLFDSPSSLRHLGFQASTL